MCNSLYIHIPFCRKKCLYCDFYSVASHKGVISDYVEVLCNQINGLEAEFHTIYIGGGTPSILDISLWGKLLTSLEGACAKGCEFTIEANPESLDWAKIRLFRSCGVNRLSVGVQSFSEVKLAKLGRIHSREEAIDRVLMAKEGGFDNISIDLIFGVWGEDLSSWKKELNEAVKLPVAHISLYLLTYEKNTALFAKLRRKKVLPLEEGVVSEMYKYNMDYLPRSEFFQYEISNFSKRRYQCRHNLNYWKNSSYFGLGPSAVSYLGGAREERCSDVKEYIKRAKKLRSTVTSRERLSPRRRAKETAALKIRTTEGIDFKWFRAHTGFSFIELEAKALKELIGYSLLKYKKRKEKAEGVCLTKKGFLFCDTVSSALL